MSVHIVASGGRFFTLPNSSLGWSAVGSFFAAIGIAVIKGVFFDRVDTSIGPLNLAGLATLLAALAALVLGVLAMVRKHDRSWAVWIVTVLPAIVIGFEIVSMIIPGD